MRTDYDTERRCGNDTAELVVLSLVAQHTINQLQVLALTTNLVRQQPHAVADEVDRLGRQIAACDVIYQPCPFEGVVTVDRAAGIEKWTCPVCGYENREEVE